MRLFKFTCLFLILFLVLSEGVLRLWPFFSGKFVHRPYDFKMGHDIALGEEELLINSRGARGALFNGEVISIATLGSSATFGMYLKNYQAWPEQLKLYNKNLHVDNFAGPGMIPNMYGKIAKELKRQNREYDLIYVVIRPRGQSYLNHVSPFYYSAKKWGYKYKGNPLIIKPLLFELMIEKASKEKLFQWFQEKVPWLKEESSLESMKEKALNVPAETVDSSYELRNYLRAENRYIQFPPPVISEAKKKEVRTQLRDLIESLCQVTDRLIVIPQRFMYSDSSLRPANTYWSFSLASNKPGYFYDEKSHYQYNEVYAQLTREILDEFGVTYIEPYQEIIDQLKTRNDINVDEVHFQKNGTALFAKLVHEKTISLKQSAYCPKNLKE